MKKFSKKRQVIILVVLTMLLGIFALTGCVDKDSGNTTNDPTAPTVKQGGIVAPDDVLISPAGDKENQDSDPNEAGNTDATTSDGKPTASSQTSTTPIDNSGDSTEVEFTDSDGEEGGIVLPAIDF